MQNEGKKFNSFEAMKRKNIETVYRTILTCHPISRIDISTKTGLNKMTVTNCVRALMDTKLVFESEIGESAAGRPPIYLELNPKYGVFLGIEINIISCKIIVAELSGKIIEKYIDDEIGHEPEIFVEKISRIIEELRKKYADREKGVAGVGIAVPGNYNYQTGSIEYIANMPQWNGFDISHAFENKFPDIPFYCQNAGRAGAKGEIAFSDVGSDSTIGYIHGAMGLALSIYKNGDGPLGDRGFQGRFGHMIIDVDGQKCVCGNNGCLEAYASVSALCQMLYKDREIDSACIDEMLIRAQSRDEAMTDALKKTIKYLSVGIANIINCFNPEKVCIGNYLGMMLRGREREIIDLTNTLLLKHYRDPKKIYISDLNEWGSALGCIAFIREDMLFKDAD